MNQDSLGRDAVVVRMPLLEKFWPGAASLTAHTPLRSGRVAYKI